jgi:transcriptional regulator with XRE-family HTH domain
MSDSTSTPEFWQEFFRVRPDALQMLLGDVYVISKAHAKGARGGRRPAKSGDGDLDELWGLVTPKFSTKPFGEAVRDLMGKQSLRGFAAKVGMHHQTLARLMSGERPIEKLYDPEGSMQLIEQIATGAKVHPSYFAEWRRLWLLSLLDTALAAQPNASIALFRKHSNPEAAR